MAEVCKSYLSTSQNGGAVWRCTSSQETKWVVFPDGMCDFVLDLHNRRIKGVTDVFLKEKSVQLVSGHHQVGISFSPHLKEIAQEMTLTRSNLSGDESSDLESWLRFIENQSVEYYELRKMKTIIRFINKHVFESTLDCVQSEVGVSARTLQRLFNRWVGCSPKHYQCVLRARRVYEFLTKTQLTIEEIAFRTGFYDVSHLYKAFRKISSKPPSFYRCC